MNMINNQIEVYLVEPQHVAMVWGQVTQWLEKGEKYWKGYYKPEHVYNAIISGQMQLWIGQSNSQIKIIMLTQLDFYPEGIQLRYTYIGGDTGSLKQVMKMFPKIELWAMEHGAVRGCVIGRDGWVKKLAKFGYQKTSVMLTKELVQNFGQNWSH